MALYNFDSDFTVNRQAYNVPPTEIPFDLNQIPAVSQLSHAEGGRNPFDGSTLLAYPYHLEEYLIPGFRSLDDAMKQYWSGMRVPTKDNYRFMRVKVAGGDKSLLIWSDDLKEGRARLPVAAISREAHQYNPEKFSPTYHRMATRYISTRRDQAAVVLRPTPWLVDYNLIVWAERKRDVEYILYQTLTRFNPLAEFRMFDGKLQGNVQIRFGGSTDASEKEIGFDQYAAVRYEVTMVAEAWLPLPEKIVKTVLGRVSLFQEQSGEILAASTGSGWFEPVQSVTNT